MPVSDALRATDESFMARALALAEKGICTTTPNPRVGCVIVSNGAVLAEGWHAVAGGPHAEIEALRQAGEKARSATAYVTLEPCCVQGKTGPCTEALINAGVGRVVYAMEDPNPSVDGRGRDQLQAAGIEVVGGILAEQARWLNRGFVKRMTKGTPWLMAKTASSLDGRTAMASGESQWITGSQARARVHGLRAESCAILTGIGTVEADNPAFTVRHAELGFSPERQPALVVVDSALKLSPQARIVSELKSIGRRLIVAHTEAAAQQTASALAAAGVELWVLPADAHRQVDLSVLLQRLAGEEFNQLMLEAGPVLLGRCLELGLLDELVAFVAPKVLGSTAKPLAEVEYDKLAQAAQLDLRDIERLGEDLMLRYLR